MATHIERIAALKRELSAPRKRPVLPDTISTPYRLSVPDGQEYLTADDYRAYKEGEAAWIARINRTNQEA